MAAAFACALFASCSLLEGSGQDNSALFFWMAEEAKKSGAEQAGEQAQTPASGSLCAKVSIPNMPAQKIPAQSVATTGDNISKSALADSSVIGVNYAFSATLAGGGKTYSATGEYDSATGECQFIFAGAHKTSAATYALTVNLNYAPDDSESKTIASGTKQITLAANASDFSAAVRLAPRTDSGLNGFISLPLQFSDAGVTKAEVFLYDASGNDVAKTYLQVDDPSASQAAITISGGSAIIQSVAGGLPGGNYNLVMFFYAGAKKCGKRAESVVIYPTLATSLWWNGSDSGSGSGGALEISTSTQTEFWIRGTGGAFYSQDFASGWTASDDTSANDGSFAAPFKTLQKAIDIIQNCGDTATEYTIIVDGLVNADPSAGYSANNDSMGNISAARKITLKGWSGSDKDILDAAAKGRALNVEAGATVTLQDVALKNGSATHGAGLSIYNASVVMQSGEISSNTATTGGGGVYIKQDSSGTANFTLNGGSVSANTVSAAAGAFGGGGGIMNQYGAVEINAGEIKGNSGGNYGGAIINFGSVTMIAGEISGNSAEYGGGVYIFDNEFAMSGGTISGNSADYGGGVYILNKDFAMSGGTISDNSASFGGGVFVNQGTDPETGAVNNGKFSMSGDACVPYGTANDVYLVNPITIAGNLAEGAIAATITPNNYETTFQALQGTDALIQDNREKFAVLPDSAGDEWGITATGKLCKGHGVKTGAEINAIIKAYTTVPFASSATPPASGTTIKGYLDYEETMPIWYNSGTVYYYAKGCTDGGGKKIALNKNSATMFKSVKFTSIDLSAFDTSRVEDMSQMFESCNNLSNLDVTGFDTSNVFDMSGMFHSCSGIEELDVTGFDTRKVTNMSVMFSSCSQLKQLDVSGFDTSGVTTLAQTFFGCKGITELDLTNWDLSKVTSMYWTFDACENLERIYISAESDKEPNKTILTNVGDIFNKCSKLKGGCGTACDGTTHVSDIDYVAIDKGSSQPGFFTDKSMLKTGADINIAMLQLSTSATAIKPSAAKPDSSVETKYLDYAKTLPIWVSGTDLLYYAPAGQKLKLNPNSAKMFESFLNVETIDASAFDTSAVETMEAMFSTCHSLAQLNLSAFDTRNVTNMNKMFYTCSELESIYVNAAKFDISRVAASDQMFFGCSKLVGGAGTTFSDSAVDATYARIDNPPSAPGYFTDESASP